jgi:hypothetical protein
MRQKKDEDHLRKLSFSVLKERHSWSHLSTLILCLNPEVMMPGTVVALLKAQESRG